MGVIDTYLPSEMRPAQWFFAILGNGYGDGPYTVQPIIAMDEPRGPKYGPFKSIQDAQSFVDKIRTVRVDT